jgi:hypothetical protein
MQNDYSSPVNEKCCVWGPTSWTDFNSIMFYQIYVLVNFCHTHKARSLNSIIGTISIANHSFHWYLSPEFLYIFLNWRILYIRGWIFHTNFTIQLYPLNWMVFGFEPFRPVAPKPYDRPFVPLRFPPQYHISYKCGYYSAPLYINVFSRCYVQ